MNSKPGLGVRAEKFISINKMLILFFAIGAAASSPSFAAAYPERPIRLIVAYAPGTNADHTARKLSTRISAILGQQFVVDNRSGAGGIIGTELASKSPADGYTLLFGTAQAMVTNVYLYRSLPYDPVKHFSPITRVGTHPHFIVVPLSVPVKSVAELIAYAKARPGQLNYASTGSGTNGHLSGALFGNMAAINIAHIPYNGAAQAITDLVSGRTQLMSYSYPPLAPMIRAGKLRVLATTGEKRSDIFPELPTVMEAGVPGFVITGWEGVFAPAGAPREIIMKIQGAVAETLKDPDLIADIKSDGGEPALNTPDAFAAFIRSELVRYRKIVEISGAKVE